MSTPLSSRIASFLKEEKEVFDEARVNYAALKNIRIRSLVVDGWEVLLQFNPARIRSSSAKMDACSVRERNCFLCRENRPAMQGSVPFGDSYEILVNPFPIFPEHLTIPSLRHEDQLIRGRYADMLSLAAELPDFVLFYNGPRCGASAPDHMHFQAGTRGVLPVERAWERVAKETVFASASSSSVLYAVNGYTHPFLMLVSSRKQEAVQVFDALYALLPLPEEGGEPMMNLLAWYEGGRWISCLFPREKLRPCCYYARGEAHLLLSPASVEMGGLFAVAREEDFLRITESDIRRVYAEVCLGSGRAEELIKACKRNLNV